MCRIGFVAFTPRVEQEKRKEILTTLLNNSWELGNRDGLGFTTWVVGKPAVISRALTKEALKFPEAIGDYALIHARQSTNEKKIENTHPFSMEGAVLVHNGIVRVEARSKDEIDKLCASTCDSERILAAYILANRKLSDGLQKIEGHANVMMWDGRRNVLSVFGDNSSYYFWRQHGVTVLLQEIAQGRGVIRAGFGFPYEADTLDPNKVYEFPLAEGIINWGEELAKAEESAVALKVPSSRYMPPTYPYCYNDGPAGHYYNGAWDLEHNGEPQTDATNGPASKKKIKRRILLLQRLGLSEGLSTEEVASLAGSLELADLEWLIKCQDARTAAPEEWGESTEK